MPHILKSVLVSSREMSYLCGANVKTSQEMVPRTVQKKWKQRIGKMTKDELLEIMQEPETYNTEYLWMVRNRLSDDFGISIGRKKPKYPRSDRTPLSKYHYNCTKTLLVETLDKMKYPYRVEQDDKTNLCGCIHLVYRGADFIIYHEDSDFIRIQLLNWMSTDSRDVEQVSQVRRALNAANWNSPVTTVYSFVQKNDCLTLSCQAVFLLIPQIPDLTEYLEKWLCEFFSAQDEFSLEWQRIENQKNTRT